MSTVIRLIVKSVFFKEKYVLWKFVYYEIDLVIMSPNILLQSSNS